MSIGKKMVVLTGIAVLGLGGFGYAVFNTMAAIRINGDTYGQIKLRSGLSSDLSPARLELTEPSMTIQAMLEDQDPAKLRTEFESLNAQRKQFNDAYDFYMKQLPEGKLKEGLSGEVHEKGSRYLELAINQFSPILLVGDRGSQERAAIFNSQSMQPLFQQQRAAVSALEEDANTEKLNFEQGADRFLVRRTWILSAGGFLILVFAISFGVSLARVFFSFLHEVLSMASEMSRGNLNLDDMKSQSRDEIGHAARAMNEMKRSLVEMIRSTAIMADRLATASGEISSSVERQAQGAETQKDQTNQVAAAMEEMASTVLQVSENSTKAADASRDAAETAKSGGKIVDDTLGKMRAIAHSVGETAKKVQSLGKGSDQIGEIIGVIDDIADQTNLLALNAAIEAARAGEQGRGFAVVADEVRKLAERTGKATKEIAQMIKGIQSETKNAVGAMEEGMVQVEEGVKSTVQAGRSLQEIIRMSEQVGDMILQIATAATEQSSTTEQINVNVEQIATISQESASASQHTSKSVLELSSVAQELHSQIAKFDIGNNVQPGESRKRTPERSSGGPKSLRQREPDRELVEVGR
jgi:methyl-accepting chemotaxis protein